MQAKPFAFLLAVVIVAALFAVYHVRLSRSLAKNLASRELVPASEFGRRHYSDSGRAEIAVFVLVKLQELIGYELAGVLPTDRINADLQLAEIDSLANVEIITEVESRFGIKITNDEAARIQTVGELVELIASKRSGLPFSM